MCDINDFTHGSFFSGIGGFELGAHAAGFTNIFNCEIDNYKRNELKKISPDAIQYTNIETMPTAPQATVWSAGFPCQDISIAQTANGGAKGIFGQRSSLFFTLIRLVAQVRPPYLILENSPMLVDRGLHEILSCFTEIGYMCEWHCLEAKQFGYPHKRRRLYIIAYPYQARSLPVYRPLKTVSLSLSWAPDNTFRRVCSSRTQQFRDITAISKNDVIPGYAKQLSSYGDAVMPVVAEYLFKCIWAHIEILPLPGTKP